ncbi:enoyl-CoA hydratase-related protein [Rhodococcus sp. IEGM 1409]|uniref:enoyl-CoA hydratase-related protein n=1 Tax=Rhodococcus sp. IEGM 1409 TaxID=3047082 RepID=UPI0024B69722|nr:enoyl-CoA hydratase-related protein [Rhodococcus sp. IEGM 1409]MDI9899228.1 enoyl-CoA hydratase-related protein [Rhodococcus sp. IEGM 1409]
MTETHEDISIIRHGENLDVVFNRPEKHNALTPQIYDAIAGACRRADSDRKIRLLTLRGAGGEAFSAGSDIRHFQTFSSFHDGLDYESRFVGVLTELEKIRVPTLAVIDGVCAGAGLLLSAACDVRIATHGSRFCLPIARTLGNSLSIHSVALLADRIGSNASDVVGRSGGGHVERRGSAERLPQRLCNRGRVRQPDCPGIAGTACGCRRVVRR